MSWVRVWIHTVFTTKNREALITKEIRQTFFQHIKENAKKKDIWLEEVNGHNDHVHCLISLHREMTISKTMQLIKGESSFWLNKQKLIPFKFQWQDDYWAVSVSESHVKNVKKYIQNQEEHHKDKNFNEEINLFMEKYGWELIQDGK